MRRMAAAAPLATMLLVATGVDGAFLSRAAAQQVATTPDKVSFNIPAQPLSAALRAFAETTHLQLVYGSDLVAGRRSSGISGSYTATEALQQLLAGSGLAFRFVSAGVVTVEKPSADGARVIGTVDVEGNKTAGANGSTDPTATEGTGSYTSDALTIGSKTAQSIRQTPQSVSVVTQQQIKDQHLTTLTEALQQATGISVVTNANGQPIFYSRGFTIGSFQSDGGSPAQLTGNFQPMINLAEYDHIEVLRGSDGLFSAYGQPGGIINLVRKRPLDHYQTILEGAAGSWSNYREMLDVTGPVPTYDGKVRGRFVMENQDQHYFYKTAEDERKLLYGILEADLTDSTLLTMGGSYKKENTVPWYNGLPRYGNGGDLRLPRDTCMCEPWNRWNFDDLEAFARLEQRLGDDWKVKLNLTELHQTSFFKYAQEVNYVDPVTGTGPQLQGNASSYNIKEHLADLTVNGKFSLFGRTHELVVGTNVNYSYSSSFTFPQLYGLDPTTGKPNGIYPAVNVFDFDASVPEPATGPATGLSYSAQTQYGVYSTLKVELLDALHLAVGARESVYNQANTGWNLQTNKPTTYSAYGEKGVPIPYYGLVYDITKQWSLYGSYASIFSSQANFLDASLKPLPPVTGATYETGTKAELLDRKLNLHAAVYYTDRSNQEVTDPSVTGFPVGPYSCCYLPSGQVISKGIDVEIAGKILPGWELTAGYTYNSNHFKTPVASLNGTTFTTLSPSHLFKLWTTYQLPGPYSAWTVGFGANAQSFTYVAGTSYKYTSTGNIIYPGTPFSFTQPGYGVFSASVAYQIDKTWSAALNVDNIFDRTYYKTVGSTNGSNWYGPPRSFMLTMRAKW